MYIYSSLCNGSDTSKTELLARKPYFRKDEILLDNPVICSRKGFLVCIKSPGIESEDPGLPSLLRFRENLPALYPVHRLDKGTGGLAVLAKDKTSCAILSEAFTRGRAEKCYLAVVQAEKIMDSGFFEDLLYHDRRTNKSYVVSTMRKGVKKASCGWRLLGSVQAEPVPLHLVLIGLHTGRTHQIRIQFASRRMPLYGDSRYGSSSKAAYPALWACSLSFPDPEKSGSILSFRSDPPSSNPWNRFSDFLPVDEEAFRGLPKQSGEFPLR